jgi:hypothetical protein
MRPRQALVPVISASYAKQAQNADRLNGFDWSALFGVNNPSGNILGSRIAPGTVTSNQIALANIGRRELATGAVTGAAIEGRAVAELHIAPGAVGPLQIAANAVHSAHLTNGAVTIQKLQSRVISTNAPVGGIAVSLPVVTQRLTGSSFENIEPLTVTLHTTGRPVMLFLASSITNSLGDTPASTRFAGLYFIAQGGANYGHFRVIRDMGRTTQAMLVTSFGSGAGGSESVGYPTPLGPMLDLPPAGRHTYKLQWGFVSSEGQYVDIHNQVLVAFEL